MDVWMRIPMVGIAHYDVVSRAALRTYSDLNIIVDDQHSVVPNCHARVYNLAQAL
jgi:hypothetical protein